MESNTLIFGAFILGGVLFIGLAINQFMKARKAAETWPVAAGTVLNSSVQTHTRRNSRGQTTRSYEPRVSYQYQVGGQTFTGERLGFGNASYGQGKADKKIALYPQGAPVSVHYDPADPSKAVLETKAAGGASYLALGIILLVVGVFGLILRVGK